MKLKPTDDLTIEVWKGDANSAPLLRIRSRSQTANPESAPGVLGVWGHEIHALIRGLQMAAVALGVVPGDKGEQ